MLPWVTPTSTLLLQLWAEDSQVLEAHGVVEFFEGKSSFAAVHVGDGIFTSLNPRPTVPEICLTASPFPIYQQVYHV